MTMTRYRSTVLYPQCGEYLLPLCFSVVSGGSGGGSGGGEREEFLECGWRRVTRWRQSVRVRVSPLTRPVSPTTSAAPLSCDSVMCLCLIDICR